jgi:hypothetical protein
MQYNFFRLHIWSIYLGLHADSQCKQFLERNDLKKLILKINIFFICKVCIIVFLYHFASFNHLERFIIFHCVSDGGFSESGWSPSFCSYSSPSKLTGSGAAPSGWRSPRNTQSSLLFYFILIKGYAFTVEPMPSRLSGTGSEGLKKWRLILQTWCFGAESFLNQFA